MSALLSVLAAGIMTAILCGFLMYAGVLSILEAINGPRGSARAWGIVVGIAICWVATWPAWGLVFALKGGWECF